MNKQDKDTGKAHKLHSDTATKIEPFDDWEVQTKYGTLRLPGGLKGVRLADVHSWLTRDGRPAGMVVSEMFEPLLRAACYVCSGYQEAEAIRIVSSLHLMKPTRSPVPLFESAKLCRWDEDPTKCENVKTFSCRTIFPKGPKTTETHVYRYVPQLTFAGGIDINTLRTAFPDQGHYDCEDGTIAGLVYALSIGARRVLVAGADLQTDVVAVWQQKKEAEDEAHHGINWPRHEIVRAYVNRLAVPIAVAHELWGWGREVAVEAEIQAAPAMGSEATQATKPQKVKWKDAAPEWTKQRLRARRIELDKQKARNPVAQMSKESGLPAREINRRVNEGADGGAISVMAGQLKGAGTRNKAA